MGSASSVMGRGQQQRRTSLPRVGCCLVTLLAMTSVHCDDHDIHSLMAGHRMYMGTAAISSGDYIHHAIDHADLIILVGHDVSQP